MELLGELTMASSDGRVVRVRTDLEHGIGVDELPAHSTPPTHSPSVVGLAPGLIHTWRINPRAVKS